VVSTLASNCHDHRKAPRHTVCTKAPAGLSRGCACCVELLLQVLERLKAASAYVQLAQSFTKPTKAAESKLARAAAKLSKCTTLEVLQSQLQAAAEAAEQLCSTVKVCTGPLFCIMVDVMLRRVSDGDGLQ